MAEVHDGSGMVRYRLNAAPIFNPRRYEAAGAEVVLPAQAIPLNIVLHDEVSALYYLEPITDASPKTACEASDG